MEYDKVGNRLMYNGVTLKLVTDMFNGCKKCFFLDKIDSDEDTPCHLCGVDKIFILV